MSDDERSTPASDVVIVTAKDLESSEDERRSNLSSRKTSVSSSRKSSVASLNPAAGDVNPFDEPAEEPEDPLFKDKLIPLDNSIPEADYNKIYTEDTRARAIVYLIIFSGLMIVIPGVSMYVCYYYIFQEIFHEDTSTAMLYSGVVAIIEVYLIVAAFIYLAYRDEQHLERVVAGTADEPKDKDQ
uniref:Transmembrane protein 230 n=1 Tax=Panagrellus redivivus TaxID=6233 RepID=A0A7E4UXB6_PANRE